ncbi:hypothetical protein [Acaryochloris sp. IP29b_bin.137]|uniref:hypothetical protein n=1 Tax=Acaryochloris sp. IP29b_bin.137 TaxID=2969217 RepID=UPI00260E440F|nr:hypothetical protein [Acaryochloris sp. IP29b_bin.137]
MAELPQSLSGLLTLEENAQIDQTLLPTRERFSIRLTVYCWRYLQQLSEKLQTPIESLQSEQIHEWVAKDTQLQEGQHVDAAFMDWFSHLVTSSLNPLGAISQHYQVPIKDLTLKKVMGWYLQQ